MSQPKPDIAKHRERGVIAPSLFAIFTCAPLLVLVSMSFGVAWDGLAPTRFGVDNYLTLFSTPEGDGYDWRDGFGANALASIVVAIVTLLLAIPAAFAFARFRFLGDRHLFFWLLVLLVLPGLIYGWFWSATALAWPRPVAQLAVTVPLAVWILEGAMRRVPLEVDETARIDGIRPGFFVVRLFLPMIAAEIALVGAVAFLFAWGDLSVAEIRENVSVAARAAGEVIRLDNPGLAAAAGVVMLVPGAILLAFLAPRLGRALSLGRV